MNDKEFEEIWGKVEPIISLMPDLCTCCEVAPMDTVKQMTDEEVKKEETCIRIQVLDRLISAVPFFSAKPEYWGTSPRYWRMRDALFNDYYGNNPSINYEKLGFLYRREKKTLKIETNRKLNLLAKFVELERKYNGDKTVYRLDMKHLGSTGCEFNSYTKLWTDPRYLDSCDSPYDTNYRYVYVRVTE